MPVRTLQPCVRESRTSQRSGSKERLELGAGLLSCLEPRGQVDGVAQTGQGELAEQQLNSGVVADERLEIPLFGPAIF